MNSFQTSSIDLKQFSGFEKEISYPTVKNITGIPIAVALNLANYRETGFSCYAGHGFDSSGHLDGGYSIEILSLLQEVLKFRLNFKALDKRLSQKLSDKARDEVDLVACHTPLDSLPNNADILLPTLNSRLVLVYKSSSQPTEKDLFMRNITGTDVWFYLIGVLILLSLCFRLSTYIHSCLNPRHSDWSWLEVIQCTLGSICQQGSFKQPQGCSCRTMFLIGFWITYLIYTGYAAGITSLLSVKTNTVELPWDKALKLRLPHIALCHSDGDKYLHNLKVDGYISSVSKCADTMEELLETVETSNSAAVMSKSSLVRFLTSTPNVGLQCEMSFAKQIQHNYFSGLVIKQNSTLKHLFNYWLMRFKEHGLLKRLLSKSFEPLPECHMPPGYTEVSLGHVKSAFLIVVLPMVASVFMLFFEILFFKKGMFSQNKHGCKLFEPKQKRWYQKKQ